MAKFWSEEMQCDMRSSWEVEIARILTELGIEFLYEPKRFYYRKEKESYLPDFYLVKEDIWIEVKGYYDYQSQKRQRLFAKHNKDQVLFMIFKKEYEAIRKNPGLLRVMIIIAAEEKKDLNRTYDRLRSNGGG